MTFTFNFTEKDVHECIVQTEGELRNLIYHIMVQRYGLNWEDIEKIGFDNSKKAELEKRRKDEQKRFPNQLVSERLVISTINLHKTHKF